MFASHGQWTGWLCRCIFRQAFSLHVISKATEKHLNQAPQFTSPALTKHCWFIVLFWSGAKWLYSQFISLLGVWKDIHVLQKADHKNLPFSSSLSRENDCIPVAPSYVGSRNWGNCPYSSWSAVYLWEETQPHLGIGPQGAHSSCLLPCVVLSMIKSEGNIYSYIDIATGSQMVQKWFLECK